MKLALAVAALLASGSPALACKHFKYWHYLTPQLCDEAGRWHGPVQVVQAAAPAGVKIVPKSPEIPLPDLKAIEWGDSLDENARARLILKSMLRKDGQ
jgi:hypothetical protein